MDTFGAFINEKVLRLIVLFFNQNFFYLTSCKCKLKLHLMFLLNLLLATDLHYVLLY